MLFTDKAVTYLGLLFLSLFFVSCGGATPKRQVIESDFNRYMSDKPNVLRPAIRKLFSEPKKDLVKYELQVATDAMSLGHNMLAKSYYDRVLNNLENYFVDTKTAMEARSLWYEEGQKEFKGEPYERAMAFYYRGLLYIKDGDLENARAVFKSAMLQDAFAEEEQNRCDFALLVYLQAYVSRLNNDLSLYQAAMNELKTLRPDFQESPNDNFLFIVETGKSPRKVADGVGHSELKFRRGKKFSDVKAEISIDGQEFQSLYPIEDIFWQATSRGGRAFDKILEGKVQFRNTAADIGTTLTSISSIAMVAAPLLHGADVANVQGIAGAIGVIGGVSTLIAMNAKPHADVRYWNNLPDTVHVLPTALEQGEHIVEYRFKDKHGNILSDLSQKKKVVVSKRDVIDWTRSRKQLSFNYKI